jgi:hypothetical protein
MAQNNHIVELWDLDQEMLKDSPNEKWSVLKYVAAI